MRLVGVFLFILNLNNLFAEFNTHFSEFIEENYGAAFLDTLQRTDLGESGSFGGKDDGDDKIERDPIIFIHGVSDVAGGKMQSLAAKFRKKGYKNSELYATSYADGSKNNPLSWADYSMKCAHVKQIRTFILAVRYYTLRDVDIIAYSLGVPIARKAILGGTCVDTKEDLGSPLTDYIDTFVGIAGPNHGIALQIAGISIPGCVIGAIPILPICSKVIGLYSGICPTESQFLTDINKIEHYEGRNVYSILSKTDNWIGYEVCGQITAQIPGEDNQKTFNMYNHDEILEKTCDLQIQMIEKHRVVDDDSSAHRDNSTIAYRRRYQNMKKEDVRDSRTKSVRKSGNVLSSEKDNEFIGGRRSQKINSEDHESLMNNYEHPSKHYVVHSSRKQQTQVVEKQTATPSISKSQIVEIMKMSDGTRGQNRDSEKSEGNVISEREKAEGTYGSLEMQENLPKYHYARDSPPMHATNAKPSFLDSKTMTRKQLTKTTQTATKTSTTYPPASVIQSDQPESPPSESSQSLSSKTNGFFPHPYENKGISERQFHTQVKIAYN